MNPRALQVVNGEARYHSNYYHYCSHTKYVSKLHGESFHLSPLPSRFQSSIQFSSSPFSYRKLFGSPAFQLVNVIGFPFAIQKKLPSSAKSVPDVQKCSLPYPGSYEQFTKSIYQQKNISSTQHYVEYFLSFVLLRVITNWIGESLLTKISNIFFESIIFFLRWYAR